MRNHRVAVLGFDGMAPFELGVAAEVFALPRPELDVDWWYTFALCAERPGPLHAVGGFTIEAPHGLRKLAQADTIVVPGTADLHADPSDAVLETLRRAHARGARLVSICSGAFVLAATGLLDGLVAATHWRHADLLQARFPRVRVDANILYIAQGRILTSAGTAAGIDACLQVVRVDHGADIASRVARRMVVAPHRDGGQAQFAEQPIPRANGDDPVTRAMARVLEQLPARISVEELAREVHLSPRHFARRFRAATGTSPARWLIDRRVDASLPLLERDSRGVEDVGRAVGFADPGAFRRHFRNRTGLSPSTYRHRFRTDTAATSSGSVGVGA